MSSTCFEPEGSSSGRRLYVQVWYNLLTVHTMPCKQTIPYLYVQPSSWWWTLWSETCWRHRKKL